MVEYGSSNDTLPHPSTARSIRSTSIQHQDIEDHDLSLDQASEVEGVMSLPTRRILLATVTIGVTADNETEGVQISTIELNEAINCRPKVAVAVLAGGHEITATSMLAANGLTRPSEECVRHRDLPAGGAGCYEFSDLRSLAGVMRNAIVSRVPAGRVS
ncbi:MAG: hypothetical protein ABSH20_20335 [Tepidisphaeraceae bacterium]|jgi:hypothetical protein